MEIDDITFHNKLDIQLRFTDADPFGHVMILQRLNMYRSYGLI